MKKKQQPQMTKAMRRNEQMPPKISTKQKVGLFILWHSHIHNNEQRLS